MKKLISILLISILLLASCSAAEQEQPLVSEPVGELEPEMVHVGGLYTDTFMGISLELNHPDWIFDKMDEPDEVFFFNKHREMNESVIIISMFEVEGDAEEFIEELWENAKIFHAMIVIPGTDITYFERKNIIIGGEYGGYMYEYVIDYLDDEVYTQQMLFWYTGGNLYQCAASASLQNIGEVESVLGGILETFAIID
jgi:hypothetical protein